MEPNVHPQMSTSSAILNIFLNVQILLTCEVKEVLLCFIFLMCNACVQFHPQSTDTPLVLSENVRHIKSYEIFTWSMVFFRGSSYIHFYSPEHAKATSFETFDTILKPESQFLGYAYIFAASIYFINLVKVGKNAG